MSNILNRNYEVAKRIRNRQIVNNIDHYKEKHHNSDNSISGVPVPQVVHPVFVNFPGKPNSLKFGVIIKINSSASLRIKFQDKKVQDIPTKLVKPLIIPELAGSFQST